MKIKFKNKFSEWTESPATPEELSRLLARNPGVTVEIPPEWAGQILDPAEVARRAEEKAAHTRAAFLTVGLDTNGHLPPGQRLIFVRDGKIVRDEEFFRLSTNGAEINEDGEVTARVEDCEGFGNRCRILGTFPDVATEPRRGEAVQYAPDGNLSSDFEETW